MHKDTIVFQVATQFLPKVSLCIERLMSTLEEACQATHPVIHHYALNNIFEIMKLIEKPELKSRFLKEFMRIEHSLNKSALQLSNQTFAKLFVQIQVLSHLIGRFGEDIHVDPFLQSIRLIQSAHSVDGELYAPQLLLWLENDPSMRQKDLSRWLKQLKTLKDTVSTYLALFRESSAFECIVLNHGFFQCPLPSKSNAGQLIMLRMQKAEKLVPKIQIGHHGLSIRLCDVNSMREVQHQSVSVELSICQL